MPLEPLIRIVLSASSGAWGRLTSSCNGMGKGKGKGRETGEKLMQEPRRVMKVEAVETEVPGPEGVWGGRIENRQHLDIDAKMAPVSCLRQGQWGR